jgi:hypothetical protein
VSQYSHPSVIRADREASVADKQTKNTKRVVAATIAATLVAHGKAGPEDIADAIRVYRACLDELNKPPPKVAPDPEQERRDQTIVDHGNREAKRTIA